MSDTTAPVGLLPGWTVYLLTGEQLRERFPGLVDVHDPEEGLGYFNEVPAHGNATWVDYIPDLVLVVVNPAGEVAVASAASEWHMRALGAALPQEVTR